ncbi:MAG TPA: hypothetical protein VHL78_01960 [Actinomycetota bacterium]|nr:hypothetical protein [Actinomycetota bacterium]
MIEPADVDVHLATCADCAGELARYREVLAAARSLRGVLESPAPDLPDRVLAHVLGPEVRWRSTLTRLAHDRRTHVAAASVGGALVGAGAIALLWARAMRRAMAGAGGGAAA